MTICTRKARYPEGSLEEGEDLLLGPRIKPTTVKLPCSQSGENERAPTSNQAADPECQHHSTQWVVEFVEFVELGEERHRTTDDVGGCAKTLLVARKLATTVLEFLFLSQIF